MPVETPDSQQTAGDPRPWDVRATIKSWASAWKRFDPGRDASIGGWARSSAWHAPVFVWIVWVILFAYCLSLVRWFASPIPRWEDWFYVPFVTGRESPTLSKLWEQWDYHRSPIIKGVCYAAFKVSRMDVRSVMLLNVGCYGLVAAAMIWAMRRARGRTIYTDAVLAFALLNPGHAAAYLWAQGFTYIAPNTLAGLVLVIIVADGARLGARSAIIAGLASVGLTGCGANGLVTAAPLAAWLGYAGLLRARSGDSDGRGAGRLAIAFSLAATALMVLYVATLRPVASHPMTYRNLRPRWGEYAGTFLDFLAMAYGPAAIMHWPLSGGVGLATLLVGAAGLVWALRRRDRAEVRMRDLGLLAFWASFLLLAVAITGGRTPWGKHAIFNGRYTSMAAPLLCLTYYIIELSCPRRYAPLARSILYTLVVAAASQNVVHGQRDALDYLSPHLEFRKDMEKGVPVSLLIQKHYKNLSPSQELLHDYLIALHDAGYKPYRNLRPDPPMRGRRIPVVPAETGQVVWQGGSGQATGDDPYLQFNLDRPTFVYGLRIKYSHDSGDGLPPDFQVRWREHGKQEFIDVRSYACSPYTGGRVVEVPVWLYDTIDQIRIRPDKRPCRFSIEEIELLLPP